jgi:stage V sporulation protein B
VTSASDVTKGETASATASVPVDARAAGRGGVAVLGAKVFFILVGFVQQPALKLLIGLAEYGALARVLAVANVVNSVVLTSSTQGVSRAVARARGREGEALRATLRVHVPVAVVLTVLCVAGAPLVARFEGAPHIALPLMVLAGIVFLYGLYAPLIGALNGRGMFTRQAALDVTFAVLRTAGLLGVGWLFVRRGLSGTLGASLGWVVAGACILPLALRWTGIGVATRPGDTSGEIPHARAYLRQLLPLAAAQYFANTLMQVDITVLGRFLSHSAATAGIGADAESAADQWVGIYRACQLFAFLPYQLLFSVTQVLFPMVARANADGDAAAVRRYVGRGARIGAIVCGLLVAVVVALPGSLLAFAYGRDVADGGASALRVLTVAQGAFAMLAIGTTVLNSLGKEWMATLVTFGAILVVGTACWVVVPGAAFGEAQLVGTAFATGGGLVVALAAVTFVLRARVGAFVPLATALRVPLAVAVCGAAGLVLPRFGRLVTPVAALGIAALYVVLLVVTRELGADDVKALKAMASRRRGG